MIRVTESDFTKVLKQRGQTAVVFVPRQETAATVEEFLENRVDEADVHLATAVVPPASPLARQYRIGPQPTMIIFENGRAQRRLEADQPDGFTEQAVKKFLR